MGKWHEGADPSDDAFGDDSDDFDSEFDLDDEPTGPVPHVDDRLWRHPAEVAAAARAAALEQTPDNAGPEKQTVDLDGGTSDHSLPTRSRSFALATTALVGLMILGGLQLRSASPGATGPAATDTAAASADVDTSDSWTDVLRQRIEPGLPLIEVVRDGEMHIGRGIALDDSGTLITSARFIEGAAHITVRSDQSRHPALILGTDLLTDVAVLSIDATTSAARLATAGPQAGQYAIVEHNRAGKRDVAVGQITKIGDATPIDDVLTYGLIKLHVDTDGAEPVEILPGSAVTDDTGTVIGMAPFIQHDGRSEGSGVPMHAVPVTLAFRIAEQIIAHGGATHSWIGIQGTDAASSGTGAMTAPLGAAIVTAYENGPAARAGLLEGDIITGLADQHVLSMADLVHVLRSLEPNDLVSLNYLRDGELSATTLRLDALAD